MGESTADTAAPSTALDARSAEHVDLHTRLARSPIGRWFVAAAMFVVGSWIVLPNAPAGPLRAEIEPWWRPATELGLVQDWAVFSPNPRSQSLDVRAEIELASGEVLIWDVPDFDPVVGAFRSYRWRKWQERVRLDARADLWAPTVDWLRRTHDDAIRITLIRRWIDHEPLTADGAVDRPANGWNEFRFCSWTLDGTQPTPTCRSARHERRDDPVRAEAAGSHRLGPTRARRRVAGGSRATGAGVAPRHRTHRDRARDPRLDHHARADVGDLLGDDAIVPVERASDSWRWWALESTASVWLALAALAVAALAVTIGFRPTVFLLVSFVLLVSIQRRNPVVLNSGDLILRDLTLLLALCPTGAACSFDRWRRLGRDGWWTADRVAPWGLRLVQLQVSVVYLFAFWSKSGDLWREGTAVSTSLRLDDLQRFGQADWIVESIWWTGVITWGTLLVELLLGVLLWVPRLRPTMIVVGLLLHLSIDGVMLVGFFGPAMAAGLCSFLDGDAVQRRVDRLRARRHARRVDRTGREGQLEPDLGTA